MELKGNCLDIRFDLYNGDLFVYRNVSYSGIIISRGFDFDSIVFHGYTFYSVYSSISSETREGFYYTKTEGIIHFKYAQVGSWTLIKQLLLSD